MKKISFRVLMVVLVFGLTLGQGLVYAQHDHPGEPAREEEKVVEEEKTPEEEKAVEENKTYTCPECGYSSDTPEGCPACNVPLVEEKTEEPGDAGSEASSEGEPAGGEGSGSSGDEEPKDEEPKDEEPKDEERSEDSDNY